MVVAGESSGDVHAAHLVKALSARIPGLGTCGMGGRWMAEAGVRLIHDIGAISIVGFAGVPRAYPRLRRIKKDLLRNIRERKPRAVIFVDYPGFNLSLARSVRALPRPPKLVYFITPQVWAWWRGRARAIAEVCDLALNILPFEPRIFRELGGRAEFVGHPLAYALRDAPSREAARRSLSISADERAIALLPGSRLREVDAHAEAMAGALGILREETPGLRFLISEADSLPEGYVSERLKPPGGGMRPVRGDSHRLIRAADAVVVASGTASLETALLGAPMVVIYAGDALTYLLAKYFLLRVDYISLVNLLSGREAVPELHQSRVRPRHIADALREVLFDEGVRARQIRAFERIRGALEGENPYARAAARIAAELGFDGEDARDE